MNKTVDEIYQQIKPGDLDEDVSVMMLDWSFKCGVPRIDTLWVVEDGGIFFPIEGTDCFICLFKTVFEAAFDNENVLEVNDSVRMFLLSVINHQNKGEFADEYYYYSAAALLDIIIADSGHNEDGEANG